MKFKTCKQNIVSIDDKHKTNYKLRYVHALLEQCRRNCLVFCYYR